MSWPHALSPTQNGLVSAALRHVTDAESLIAASPAQALYLAGYGPECARKAALARWNKPDEDRRNKAIGHRFDKPAETALALFCDLDPLASRYTLRGWKATHSSLSEWKEDVRYGRSDSVTRGKAQQLLSSARELTVDVIAKLWVDGRVEDLSSLVKVKP